MSYLLPSTGPVKVGDVTLTEDNAVEELLSKPYLSGDNAAQDAFFAKAAQSLFTAVTGSLQEPMEFLRGLEQGADEGRIHLTSFDTDEQEQLAGTALEWALPTAKDAGSAPQVQVTVNDATGSKMSYYLRYQANVEARRCSADGSQELLGSMSLNQSIRAAEAASLPNDVTGGGLYGTEPGKQLVIVRIYGPVDGAVGNVKLDGAAIESESRCTRRQSGRVGGGRDFGARRRGPHMEHDHRPEPIGEGRLGRHSQRSAWEQELFIRIGVLTPCGRSHMGKVRDAGRPSTGYLLKATALRHDDLEPAVGWCS
jgi:hypothetical protein